MCITTGLLLPSFSPPLRVILTTMTSIRVYPGHSQILPLQLQGHQVHTTFRNSRNPTRLYCFILDNAPLSQSSLWMLDSDAQAFNDALQQQNLVVEMNGGFRSASPMYNLNALDQQSDQTEFPIIPPFNQTEFPIIPPFNQTEFPIMPPFKPITKIFLLMDVIEEAKDDAYEWMVRSIFNTSFLPVEETATVMAMAESTLNDAISQYSNGISFVYLHSLADRFQNSRAL
jgi:hypothetical protein